MIQTLTLYTRFWLLVVLAAPCSLPLVDCFTAQPLSLRVVPSWPTTTTTTTTRQGINSPRLHDVWPSSTFGGQRIRRDTLLKAAPMAMVTSSLPGVEWFVLAHIVGGFLPIPFVIGATRKVKGIDPNDKDLGGWYTRIQLPTWTPPNAIFAPVWILLYGSMGLSLHMVLRHPQMTASRRRMAALLWAVHYFSNLSWAPLFFGLKRLRAGLWVNGWLVVSLLVWMALIGHFLPAAAVLLTPYLVWVVFATFLNSAVCRLNPTKNGCNEARFQDDLIKLRQRAADYANGT
mmetsp:Transcript_3852/g.10542  ORF Transcript_3852/g.10542 Transcript_3852/m.10542 type:complete len:288 (+) Transcript_3852:67-930(+)